MVKKSPRLELVANPRGSPERTVDVSCRLYGRKQRWLPLAVLVMACSGCGTARLYDGPRRDSDDVAHIAGDLRINAGSPLTVILRRVDETPLSVGQNGVDVLPGPHHLLVDCRIAETQSVSRHSIDVEVAAGRRYRLVGEAGPGLRECTQVTLQRVDF